MGTSTAMMMMIAADTQNARFASAGSRSVSSGAGFVYASCSGAPTLDAALELDLHRPLARFDPLSD